MKATVEETDDGDPVRKAFTRVLMKTIGAHDLSLQEAFHILNGLDFVTFGRCAKQTEVMARANCSYIVAIYRCSQE